jgi:hypothetical protein
MKQYILSLAVLISTLLINDAAHAQVGPVVYVSHIIGDGTIVPSKGDGDGIAESCESIILSVKLMNQGTTTAANVEGTLSSVDSDVNIVDNDNAWPDVPGGATVENLYQFAFEVNPDLVQDKFVDFTLIIKASNGGPWTSVFRVQIKVQNQLNNPSSLDVQLQSNFSVQLNWSDNNDCEQGFRIERKINNAAYVEIAAVGKNTTNYNDHTIPFNGTYFYRVRAYNSLYNSGFLPEKSVSINLPAFLDISAPLTAVNSSTAAWADFISNDRNLDLILTGQDNNSREVTKVYQNGSGYFTDISSTASLIGVRDGSVAWGDYDNDEDLDLLLTGDATNSAGLPRVTRIYRYEGGGRFTEISTSLPGIRNGAGTWGDYDNDGDLDILLTGSSVPGVNFSEIYRNTG